MRKHHLLSHRRITRLRKKAAEEPSPPRQPGEEKHEEATYKVSEKKVEESPQPSEPQPSSAAFSPAGDATFAAPDESKDDILEFTSATEGEGESSSAWQLVPEKKIARKLGVKSDTELDHLLKNFKGSR